MKRGIYLVANLASQRMCENLIYSIRKSGCNMPIRLIHFGGKKMQSEYVSEQSEMLQYEDFPDEAKLFITNLRSVLTDCPMGFLYRFLAWFSDWDEFIYSDNDIVALCNWENLFDYLADFDVVHADEEYITNGKYNYNKPELIKSIFGKSSLESAITAGHIVVKRNTKMIDDINAAVSWFKQHADIPKKHDQSLIHVASLLGNWKILNLCRSHNWLSTWAGDYENSLQIIQMIQSQNTRISHIHYSGGTPDGTRAIQDLLFAGDSDSDRIKKLAFIGFKFSIRYYKIKQYYSRLKRYIMKDRF